MSRITLIKLKKIEYKNYYGVNPAVAGFHREVRQGQAVKSHERLTP